MIERLVEVLVCRPLWVVSASGFAIFTAAHFIARPWEFTS